MLINAYQSQAKATATTLKLGALQISLQFSRSCQKILDIVHTGSVSCL